MALRRQEPRQEPLYHSKPRLSQYASSDYRSFLTTMGIAVNMSHKGDCWGNAAVKSFFCALRVGPVHYWHYKTREKAKLGIFEYIEVSCNR